MYQFCAFLFFFTPLFGDELLNEASQEGKTYNYWSEFVNMLFTLAFVIILIIVSVWILKKIMRSRVNTLNRTNGIKILERRSLNTKSSLYLIDVLGKGVVIAESPAGIQRICEFPEEVKVEALYGELYEEQKVKPFFLKPRKAKTDAG